MTPVVVGAHCWEGNAYQDKDGYGTTRWGWGEKKQRVHRVVYSLSHGELILPVVRHACDNPPCCNPFHLEAGTYQSNSDDAVLRGRMLVGENHQNSRLTDEQVRQLREDYAAGDTTLVELATREGVYPQVVRHAVRGSTYPNAPGPITTDTSRNPNGTT